ncbi:hypothetical protein LSM04_002386 [Trypanosoma melophagium]|uniref:uncharacterized protein n=1 Tax=Trypanosoma melophagium TaxID=715481 RepID=UPI00351AA5D4|nr:hypothetical protein LSM04_002386 [Trypanosoma melophagium]
MRAIVRFNEVSFLVEVVTYHELCMEIAHCLSPILPSLTPEFICLRLVLLLSPDNINIKENHTTGEDHTTLVGMPVFSEDSFAKILEFCEKHNPHLTPVLGLDTYMSLRLPQQVS